MESERTIRVQFGSAATCAEAELHLSVANPDFEFYVRQDVDPTALFIDVLPRAVFRVTSKVTRSLRDRQLLAHVCLD